MTGFSTDWLLLREPADHAARNEAVREIVTGYLNKTKRAVVADLAAGTGSTVRALAEAIEVEQTWHLFDNDADLLEEAGRQAEKARQKRLEVQTHSVDLNRFPSGIVSHRPNLVTTSAFLDLVSADWLSRLVTYAMMERIPVYAALTYSGSVIFTPKDPTDPQIVAAHNSHQTGDKGFGPALGPTAADRLVKLFRVARFKVIDREANWRLDETDADLQRDLLTGWADVAAETGQVSEDQAQAWLTRRLEAVDSGVSRIVVGHRDVAAFPS